jgi:DNA polymerase-1
MTETFIIEDDGKTGKPLYVTYEDGDDDSGIELLKQQIVIGFDCETTYAEGFEEDKQGGLDPYRSRLRLIQFCTEDGHIYLYDNFYISEILRTKIRELLELSLPVKVGHNLKFDVKFSRFHLGVKRFGKIFCTELAYRLTKCGLSSHGRVGLKTAVQELLGITVEKELQRSNWSGELTREQLIYAAKDAYLVLPLRRALIQQINDLGLRFPAKLDFDVIDPTAYMELNGFPIIPEKWVAVDSQMRERRIDVMEVIFDELRESGVVPQLGLFSGAPLVHKNVRTGLKRNTPTNSITSPKQIGEYLELYGIDLPIRTDRKTQRKSKTTGTPFLHIMRNSYKIIPKLLEFRELDKRKTSYGSKYCEVNCNPVTGRIHADFDPQGTKTARYSNNKPNLQQIPTLPEYRACFVVPEGQVMVGGDFSQIELRIAAELSGDPGYIEAFKSGKDFHGATAEFMFGVKPGDPNYKHMRNIAKRINFGIIYGMGAGKLSLQTDLPENKDTLRLELCERQGLLPNGITARKFLRNLIDNEELNIWQAIARAQDYTTDEIEKEVAATDTAQDYLDRYYETFSTLMAWLKMSGLKTGKYKQCRMASGRLVKFWVGSERWSIKQAERNGMNTPIQGLAGEVLKIATRLLFDRIYNEGKMGIIKLILTMHDELQLECPESEGENAKKMLEESMVEAGEQFLKKVPCVVEVGIAGYWKK